MPSYIVKPSPEEDFYVVWSTVTDSPHYWGPRDILMLEMREKDGPDRARFDRADNAGSSALWPNASGPYLGWDDDTLIYEQQGILQRGSLRELCQRLEDDEDADVSDLLAPFEDDEP